MVNAIPDRVAIESFVRGSNFEAMKDANERVNRALCGAALSLGANIEINDAPGYAPLKNSDGMMALAKQAAALFPEIPIIYSETISSGSTDMGDLSTLMPVVHPYVPGASDYSITNPEKACVISAKWQLAMLVLLLKDNAETAKQIIDEFKPLFANKQEYFNYIDKLFSSGDRIEYTGNSATVKL